MTRKSKHRQPLVGRNQAEGNRPSGDRAASGCADGETARESAPRPTTPAGDATGLGLVGPAAETPSLASPIAGNANVQDIDGFATPASTYSIDGLAGRKRRPLAVRGAATNMSVLVGYGKKLSAQVQSLVESSPTTTTAISATSSSASAQWLSTQDSHADLVTKLTAAFQHQNRLNEANAKLNKVTYMVSMANYVRHRDVRMILAVGKRELLRLASRVRGQEAAIDELNDSVSSLNDEVSAQHKESARLREELGQTRDTLNASMETHHRERDLLAATLASQQRLLDQLVGRRFRQDMAVDGTLVLVSLWFVNSLAFDLPLRVALAVVPQQRLRRWLHQSTKLLAVFLMVRLMRVRAAMFGLHSSVGGAGAYARFLVSQIGPLVRLLMRSCLPPGWRGGAVQGGSVGGGGGQAAAAAAATAAAAAAAAAAAGSGGGGRGDAAGRDGADGNGRGKDAPHRHHDSDRGSSGGAGMAALRRLRLDRFGGAGSSRAVSSLAAEESILTEMGSPLRQYPLKTP